MLLVYRKHHLNKTKSSITKDPDRKRRNQTRSGGVTPKQGETVEVRAVVAFSGPASFSIPASSPLCAFLLRLSFAHCRAHSFVLRPTGWKGQPNLAMITSIFWCMMWHSLICSFQICTGSSSPSPLASLSTRGMTHQMHRNPVNHEQMIISRGSSFHGARVKDPVHYFLM